MLMIFCTEVPKMVCTWLRELCSCSCLPVLPGLDWVLLRKIYRPFYGALYLEDLFVDLTFRKQKRKVLNSKLLDVGETHETDILCSRKAPSKTPCTSHLAEHCMRMSSSCQMETKMSRRKNKSYCRTDRRCFCNCWELRVNFLPWFLRLCHSDKEEYHLSTEHWLRFMKVWRSQAWGYPTLMRISTSIPNHILAS